MANLAQKSKTLPVGLEWRSHTLFILSTVGLGIFTDLFLYGLIVPVLPFMLQARLKIPEDEIQTRVDEMLAIYAAGSVIFAPIAGFLADQMSSRQIPFLCGLSTLFAATFLLGVGKTLPILYLARLLQGISAAVVWPVGMALTMDTVGSQKIGVTMGTMLTVATCGLFIAPTVGGVLYEHVGYLGVIAVGAALLVIDFILRVLVIEKRVAAQYLQVDMLNEVETNESYTTPGESRSECQIDTEANESSLLLPSSSPRPYQIPVDQPRLIRRFPVLYYFSNISLLSSLFITLVQGIMYGSFDATIPTYTKEIFGFNSAQAGLMFISLGVANMTSGPIIGRLVDRYGTKIMASIAYIFLAGSLVSLRTVTQNTGEQLALYCILLGLCGVGLGLITTPSIVEGGLVVERYYEANSQFFGNRSPYALFYGVNQTVYMVGMTVGPLFAGTTKEMIGYGNLNAILGGISAATAVISWYTLGDSLAFVREKRAALASAR